MVLTLLWDFMTMGNNQTNIMESYKESWDTIVFLPNQEPQLIMWDHLHTIHINEGYTGFVYAYYPEDARSPWTSLTVEQIRSEDSTSGFQLCYAEDINPIFKTQLLLLGVT